MNHIRTNSVFIAHLFRYHSSHVCGSLFRYREVEHSPRPTDATHAKPITVTGSVSLCFGNTIKFPKKSIYLFTLIMEWCPFLSLITRLLGWIFLITGKSHRNTVSYKLCEYTLVYLLHTPINIILDWERPTTWTLGLYTDVLKLQPLDELGGHVSTNVTSVLLRVTFGQRIFTQILGKRICTALVL